jgi:hypothetical protein
MAELDHEKIYALLDWIDKLWLDAALEDSPKRVALIAALARKNPVIFNDFCFQDKQGNYWRSAAFHRQWQRIHPEPYSGKYVAIFAPRGHAKTSQTIIGRTLFDLGNNPNLFIKIVCNTDPKARKRVQELQKNIEDNKRVHLVFPDLLPDKDSGWEKHKFFIKRSQISREPTLEAYGILSGATGDRADQLKFDDVVDMKNAVLQPKSRQAVKESFRSVWLNLLSPEGIALYIATPWHLDDLSNEIMKDPEWLVWKEPAIGEAGDALWPELWSLDALQERQRKIGDTAFQQQFMLQALSMEDATFSEDAINRCLRPLKYGEYHRGENIPDDWPRFMSIDPGASMGLRNSPSVVMTIAVSPDKVRYPLSIFRSKIKFPQLIDVVVQEFDRWKPSLVLGENNSFQEAMIQHISSTRKDIPLKGHYTGSKKWDAFEGLPGLSAVMAGGGWVIPKPCSCDKTPCYCHNASCQCISCEWERELRYHPKWATADIVMAMWLCEVAAQAGTATRDRSFVSLSQVFDEYDREKKGG